MATIIKDDTREFKRMLELFDHGFEPNPFLTFTNLMWQYIMNRVHEKKHMVFHPVDNKDGGFNIAQVVKGDPTYLDHGVPFAKELTYTECCDVCDGINSQLFGIQPEEGDKIVGDSMAAAMAKG
jgi:hypothetical protein